MGAPNVTNVPPPARAPARAVALSVAGAGAPAVAPMLAPAVAPVLAPVSAPVLALTFAPAGTTSPFYGRVAQYSNGPAAFYGPVQFALLAVCQIDVTTDTDDFLTSKADWPCR